MLKKTTVLMSVCLVGLLIVSVAGAATLEELTPNQKIASFETEAVYLNQNGKRIGARFRHVPSKFVLDVLRIQSIPQAFMWVNTPPPTDQGEPHTLEHLLLGKGTKGRYVASLEDMCLGQSSAYTEQARTCYHYNTAAGPETFFNLFEAKLDAMIHPNYSDEEIRREVCNMGITVNPETGVKSLEEKGTVYNEMVRAFESPWGNMFYALLKKIYGDDHPLANEAGGLPDAIRTMGPKDIREFQEAYYHINNMGAVVSIGDEIALDQCLLKLSQILEKIEPNSKPAIDPAGYANSLPPASPTNIGSTEVAGFPSQNENAPGLMLLAWPPERNFTPKEHLLFELFVSNLASGETSNLYKKFIDSQTRLLDIGASSTFTWFNDDNGHALFIGFDNVTPSATTEKMIDSVRAIVMGEIRALAVAADNSDVVNEFNERLRSRVISSAREIKQFLNSPPRFGYRRGGGSRWIDHLQILNKAGGFERHLAKQSELKFVEDLLNSNKNFWKEYIAQWKLLDTRPYGMAARPDPQLLSSTEEARQGRVDKFVKDLQAQFKVENRELAIDAYEKTYGENTKVIDAGAATIKMPSFIKNPPLTQDDQLKFTVENLPGGGQSVFSQFDNITSTTTGLALNLYALPESMMVYVPVLPMVLTDIGVIRGGNPVSYDEMSESIRREILELTSYFSTNFRTERAELIVRASGSDRAESEKALGWMSDALFSPDLRVENLPRIKDALDQNLKWQRDRMRNSEETWVDEPSNGYWRQHNPLLLSAGCFLTKTHSMHRLRWMLHDAGTESNAAFFEKYLSLLAKDLSKLDRAGVEKSLNELISSTESFDPANPLAAMLNGAPSDVKALVLDAIKDLQLTLTDIPDNSLGTDITYLCNEMTKDLKVKPQTALASIDRALNMLRHQDNVRAFVISSKVDKDALTPKINAMVQKFSSAESLEQNYSDSPLVAHRLIQRNPSAQNPIFVGLVNENTRSGVHINTAKCASFEDSNPETLTKFLSARLYGGGGAHSMFMKTWGAGLAYSNGLRSNENTGRLIYYAERCPDLAQTMQFVVDQLENAPYDTSLTDYAVSQAFASIRSGATYESRGEDMAEDLADMLTPDVVKSFRAGIMKLRQNPKLYDILHKKMIETYGEVLPGYGPSCVEAAAKADAIYFVIGPEKQLSTYEEYVKSVESGVTLERIYPRDFWITAN